MNAHGALIFLKNIDKLVINGGLRHPPPPNLRKYQHAILLQAFLNFLNSHFVQLQYEVFPAEPTVETKEPLSPGIRPIRVRR